MTKESKYFIIKYTASDEQYIDKLLYNKEFARNEIVKIFEDYKRNVRN